MKIQGLTKTLRGLRERSRSRSRSRAAPSPTSSSPQDATCSESQVSSQEQMDDFRERGQAALRKLIFDADDDNVDWMAVIRTANELHAQEKVMCQEQQQDEDAKSTQSCPNNRRQSLSKKKKVTKQERKNRDSSGSFSANLVIDRDLPPLPPPSSTKVHRGLPPLPPSSNKVDRGMPPLPPSNKSATKKKKQRSASMTRSTRSSRNIPFEVYVELGDDSSSCSTSESSGNNTSFDVRIHVIEPR